MGQDSWNLMFGKRVNPVTRKGTQVDMHADEGYGGPKMIPGYNGAYKNSKVKVIGEKPKGKPYKGGKAYRAADEEGVRASKSPKKRK